MLETNKSQMAFHETFQPQLEYVAQLLALAVEGFRGDKEEISRRTGIPTGKQKGKVVPHLKYAQYMGLITFDRAASAYALAPTPLGERVYAEDPYMLEPLTRCVLHFFLTEKQAGAPQWAYLFHSFAHGFDVEIAYDFLKKRCVDHFGYAVDLGVVKNSYQSGAFEQLQLLSWTDTALCFARQYASGQMLPVYAYTLLHLWDLYAPQTAEITVRALVTECGWGASFGFDDGQIDAVLDMMADEGYVQLNRQLMPVTVVRNVPANTPLEALYSKLL